MQEIKSNNEKKKKELVHGSHSLELKFMGVKSVKEDQQMKSITP